MCRRLWIQRKAAAACVSSIEKTVKEIFVNLKSFFVQVLNNSKSEFRPLILIQANRKSFGANRSSEERARVKN